MSWEKGSNNCEYARVASLMEAGNAIPVIVLVQSVGASRVLSCMLAWLIEAFVDEEITTPWPRDDYNDVRRM
jgi:hypothetical protein